MSTNPYESPPATPSDGRRKRAGLILAVLFVLAVPAAGIAGGATCLGGASAMQLPIGGWVGVFGGVAVTLGMLVTADWFQQRYEASPQRPRPGAAVIGMLFAAPIAVLLFVIGFQTVYWMGNRGISGYEPLFYVVMVSFFTVLSLGGWIAIRRSRREHRQRPAGRRDAGQAAGRGASPQIDKCAG